MPITAVALLCWSQNGAQPSSSSSGTRARWPRLASSVATGRHDVDATSGLGTRRKEATCHQSDRYGRIVSQMGAPELIELEVTGVVAGGAGIGRAPDGRVVFVDGVLPGERIRMAVTERRRDYWRAVVNTVVDASSDRLEPPCPYVRAGCGGCSWQHVDPAAQLRLKQDIVVDALRRIAHEHEPALVAPLAVPSTAYRTTARLAVDEEGRPAYHQPGAAGLVAVETCLVAHPLLQELIATQRFPGARGVTFRVSAATGEQLSLVDPGPRSQARASLHEEVAGRRWRVSITSFFQSGPAAADLLLAAVAASVGDALPRGGRLVDAYAGVGILGGVLAAQAGADLEVIENQPAAAGDARVNLAGIDARVVQEEVAQWRATPADVVVADPARPGLGRPGVRALTAAQPARFVLASCDPASLARDTNLLRAAGYRLAAVQVLDLFPHTAHVEAVARFDSA